MNRRTEEKLIKLAYDEMLPQEAAAFEAQSKADPESARLLAHYRQIKADFVRLNDVPEMQFSGERLREAILHGGLKRRNRLAAFGWLLAPGLAAALAVVLFINRPASQESGPARQNTAAEQPTFSGPLARNDETPKASTLIIETEQSNPEHAIRNPVSFGSEAVASTPAQQEVNRSSSSSRHESRIRAGQPGDIQPSSANVVLNTPPLVQPPAETTA